MQLTTLGQLLKDSLAGTVPVYADVTFETTYTDIPQVALRPT
jgi:hypothetical protein